MAGIGLDIKIEDSLIKKIDKIDKKLSTINDSLKDMENNRSNSFKKIEKNISNFNKEIQNANNLISKLFNSLNDSKGNSKIEKFLDNFKKNAKDTTTGLNNIIEMLNKLSNMNMGNLNEGTKKENDNIKNLIGSVETLISSYNKFIELSKSTKDLKGEINKTQDTTTKNTNSETKAKENKVKTEEKNSSIDPTNARLKTLREELNLLNEKINKLKSVRDLAIQDKTNEIQRKLIEQYSKEEDKLKSLNQQREKTIKDINRINEFTNKLSNNEITLSSKNVDSNKIISQNIQRIIGLKEKLNKLNQDINKQEENVSKIKTSNNIKDVNEASRLYSKELSNQLNTLKQQYETIQRQIQALEQVNKLSTPSQISNLIPSDEEMKKRSEANRKFYEEQEKLALKQQALEEKERQRKEKERLTQEKNANKIALEEERKIATSSPQNAIDYAKNAKSIEEYKKAIKYLTEVKEKLRTDDENYTETLADINSALKEQKDALDEATLSEEKLAKKREKEAQVERKKALEEEEKNATQSVESALNFSKNTKTFEEEARAVKYLNDVRKKLNKDDIDYKKNLREINKELQRHKKNIEEVTGKQKIFNKIQSESKGIADQLRRSLLLVFSLSSIKNYLMKLIAVRGEFELQQRSLEAILQNKNIANEIWDKTIQLAVKSPFTIKELVSYTKQMAAYRIEQEKLFDSTKMLADVSAGLGVDMQRLILAYGQVKAANYLRGTELRQFSEAGINILGELSKYFTEIEQRYVSVGEVFEMVSKRLVSFEDVDEVFRRITSEGGIFYNMQEIQSQTLKGMISNLRDSMDIVINDIGYKYEDLIKNTIESFKSFLDNWEKWIGIVTPFLVSFMSSWLLIGVITSKNTIAIIKFIKNMVILRKEMKGFKNIIQGLSLAGGGVTGTIKLISISLSILIGAIGAFINKSKQAREEAEEINKLNDEMVNEAHIMIGEYKRLYDIINDNTKSYEEQKSAILKLKQAYADILPDHLKEYESIRNNANAYQEASNAIKEYYKNKYLEEAKGQVRESFKNEIDSEYTELRNSIQYLFEQLDVREARTKAIGFSQTLINEFLEENKVLTKDALYKRVLAYLGVDENDAERRKEVKKELNSNDWFEDSVFVNLKEYISLINQQKAAEEELLRVTQQRGEEELRYSKVYSNYDYIWGDRQQRINDIINNIRIIKEYLSGNTAIESQYQKALEYNKKWYESIFNETIDYDYITKDVFAFERQVLKIKENETKNFITQLQEFQSRATEEEKVVWQKFIDYHQKSLLEMRGSALQQEVRRVAEIISNDFGVAWQNVQSLIPSETETRDEFVKKLKETIDSYEKELKQYDLDKIKNAGFSLFDLDRMEAMKAELPMLKEFLSYFYVNETKTGKGEDIITKQLNVLRGMYDKYKELIKTFEESYSEGAVIEGFADAFKEAFGIDFENSDLGLFFKNSGLYEDALDKLAQAAKKTGDRIKILTEKGKVSFEIDVKLREQTYQEVNDNIDKMLSNYQTLLELKKEGVSNQFAEVFFGLEPDSLEDIRYYIDKQMESGTYGEDQKKKFEEYLKQITELEKKELEERLKKYIQYSKDSLVEKAKLKIDEYKKLKEIEKTFAIKDKDTEETKKIKTNAKQQAEEGVKRETQEAIQKLEWEALKSSDIMISLFDDTKKVGVSALDAMITKLENYKNSWSSLPFQDMKAVIDLYNKLKDQQFEIQVLSNPFKAFKKLDKDINYKEVNEKIFNEQESISANEEEIALLDEMIYKLSESADITKDLAKYNQKYNKSLESDIKVLREEKKLKQESIISSKKLIATEKEKLNIAERQVKALQEQYQQASKIIGNTNTLLGLFLEMSKLLSDDDDGMAQIWVEMAQNMGNCVLQALETQIAVYSAKVNMDLLGVSTKAFGYALNSAMGIIGWIVMAIQLILEGLKAIIQAHDKSLEKKIETWKEQIDDLSKSYERLADAIDKAMNFYQYEKSYQESIDNLQKRIELQRMSLNAEKEKKKSDKDAIKEYNESILELEDELKELRDARIEAFGGFGSEDNIISAAEEFIDSWYSAFRESGDMIDALKGKWDDFIDNLVKKQIFYNVANKYLKNILSQVDTYLEDGKLTPEDVDEIGKLRDQSVAQINEVLTQLMDGLGITASGIRSELDGLSKSKIELTEDTGQAIEAILNSARQYVIRIYEIINQMYERMSNINYNTNPVLIELKAQTRHIEDIKNMLNSVIDKTSFNHTIRVKI